MASDPLQSNENGGRIIRFRPRNGGPRLSRRGETLIGNSEPDYSPVPDLSRYQAPESSNEYRHRMIVNAIAFAFTCLLIIAGVCLAMMMSPA